MLVLSSNGLTYRLAGALKLLGERGVFEVAPVVGYLEMIAGVLATFAIGAPEQDGQ